MGYLTPEQERRASDLMALHFVSPFVRELSGGDWEELLAQILEGVKRGSGANRPYPDIMVPASRLLETTGAPEPRLVSAGGVLGVSVKTEGVGREERPVQSAWSLLGRSEDLILARPPIEAYLGDGERLLDLEADDLGERVLRCFNERVIRDFAWDRIAILLRVRSRLGREFIYWHQRAEPLDPRGVWWQDSGNAKPGTRNINAYPHTVSRAQAGTKGYPATFKFTSSGKQLYVRYRIPHDACVLRVDSVLSQEEASDALREALAGHVMPARAWRERALAAEAEVRALRETQGQLLDQLEAA